jgi:hypothetical protein
MLTCTGTRTVPLAALWFETALHAPGSVELAEGVDGRAAVVSAEHSVTSCFWSWDSSQVPLVGLLVVAVSATPWAAPPAATPPMGYAQALLALAAPDARYPLYVQLQRPPGAARRPDAPRAAGPGPAPLCARLHHVLVVSNRRLEYAPAARAWSFSSDIARDGDDAAAAASDPGGPAPYADAAPGGERWGLATVALRCDLRELGAHDGGASHPRNMLADVSKLCGCGWYDLSRDVALATMALHAELATGGDASASGDFGAGPTVARPGAGPAARSTVFVYAHGFNATIPFAIKVRSNAAQHRRAAITRRSVLPQRHASAPRRNATLQRRAPTARCSAVLPRATL